MSAIEHFGGMSNAVLLIALLLDARAQGVTGQAPYSPYSPEDNGIRPEHGGGDGGGGM